ncbi:MAG: ABC transporter permease, partial [Ectothiorhodospiraceae bacterium]
FDLRAGEAETAWQQFSAGSGVLVSEPYAYDHDLGVGDSLGLRTAEGEHRFRVAGIFRDYGAVQGVVLMRGDLYRRLYHDDRVGGVGIYAAPGTPRDVLSAALADTLRGVPGARIRDNRYIYQRSLEVFDQTFVITGILRLLAAAVAFVGVLGALMALQLDRAREYATLRALGLTRTQLGTLIGAQSGLLGLVAGLFAVPLGLILAWLLVFVINRRAFGWTMDFLITAPPLAEGVLLAVVAALLAAVYPAWHTARRLPAAGLREE